MATPSILILDGGLGTSLEDKYQIRFDASTPLWSSHLLVSDPAALLACQKDFACVPVDILLTPTYQISIDGFARTRTEVFPDGISKPSMNGFLETALGISEEATARSDADIALSLGPYGACMIPSQEYSGAYDDAHSSVEQLRGWHAERLRLFMQVNNLTSRVHFLAFETVPRLDEVVAIRQAIEESGILDVNPALKVWISCVFPGDGAMTLPDGTPARAVVEKTLDPVVAKCIPWAIGVNCTKPHRVDAIIREFEQASPSGKLALVVYPDGTSGEVYNTATQKWEFPLGYLAPKKSWERELADTVLEAVTRGRWSQIVVGGCCKTTAEDLKRLRECLWKNDNSEEISATGVTSGR